ncbi:MAG: imidazolonepropionase [Candidatus Bathyarchaeota archaeon]|nr:MAG: imidazolonepropionase [Candidatus Bathyarchaeota archaeon]
MDLLILRASELVTLRQAGEKPVKAEKMRNLSIIENGAVAIDEGKIVAVDKTTKIEQSFRSNRIVDAFGKTVMPGFVDPHTHPIFAGSREEELELRLKGLSYIKILKKGGGILKTVRETRKASKNQLANDSKETLDIMLQHGTTTVEAKSGYGLTTNDEVKCLGVAKELNSIHCVDIVPTFLGAHTVPPEYENKIDEYVKLVIGEMIPTVAGQKLAEFCDVFCERGVFDVEQSRKILMTGIECGMKPKVHADELTRLGGAELAAEVKAISAEHLLFASEDGLKAMAEESVIAILLPAASFSLMTGKYANARKMIQLQVPIALGTDFNPICWMENMQMVIAFACREMYLTPAEAITAATINAAHAINRAQEVGSLREGKKADIIILNIPSYKFLGYKFGVNLVDKVIKEGKIVVEKRE